MKALMVHIGYEFKTVFRDKTLLLLNYLFPMLFYFMTALIMPGVYPDFTKGMVPGLIVFTILVSTLLGMPNPMVIYREKGIYRSYRIYGVPLKSVFFVPAVTTIVHITIVSFIIYITGIVFFGADKPAHPLLFTAVYFITLLSFTGLGLLIGVCSPNGKITVLLAQLVFLPSMLLGGIMMPVSVLPDTMQKVSRILPAAHAMNAFNNLAMDAGQLFDPLLSIAALAAGTIIAVSVGARLFIWDDRAGSTASKLIGFLVVLPYAVSIFM